MMTEREVCLDRRVSFASGSYSGGNTSWTLPYPVVGDVGGVRLDTGAELALSRTGSVVRAAGNLSSVPVVLGIKYTFVCVPTPVYAAEQGAPDRRARLVLRNVKFWLSGTRHLQATLTVPARPPVTLGVSWDTPVEGQALEVPLHAQNVDATVELHTDGPFPVRIGSMDWDGRTYPLAKRQLP